MNYIDEIKKLKKEKNAVILAHYYQTGDIQDIADYTGDSLKLSIEASRTDADIIVFCGVHFMAETAKILSPNKKVLLPVMEAGCPMANMINEIQLAKYKSEHPNTKVLCYVNSTAKVKALSDCCVTSSNAEKIIEHYTKNGEDILYCPDQNLAKYVMDKANIKFDAWPGHCCIHNNLTKEQVIEMKNKYPNALFIAHPEAPLEVLKLADHVGSTQGLIKFAKESDAKEFIVGTEEGIMHQLTKQNKDKKFYLLTKNLVCYDMKLTKMEDIYNVLKNETNEILLDDDIISKAQNALNNMLKLS